MKELPPPGPTLDPWSQPQPKPKRGRGRPRKPSAEPRHPRNERHSPSEETRRMISNMASYGLDVATISKIAGITAATIYRHYGHEMRTASAKKDLLVLQSAFLKAVGGPDQNWEKADAATQRWWISCRQGWALPQHQGANGLGGMDLSRLTDEQLDELERIMEAAAIGPEMDAGGYSAREGDEIEPAIDGADGGERRDDPG
jgi:hypothetical protein